MSGFVYPNEVEVLWRLFIVLYPYVTGLVAGAFIVSSFYHVFGDRDLKPLSRLSLVAALAFLFGAPLPLLAHLGQPLRALNIMITPHFTSAMAGFGYIYTFYMIVLLLEIWFMYRKDFVVWSTEKNGFAARFYGLLTLGAKDISQKALDIDHRVMKVLAGIGIPAACFLHGYVGFIFGSIKANAWWSSPLMPIIFLLSAIVSGVAMLVVVYAVSCKIRREPIKIYCLRALNRYLWVFLIFAASLELIEVLQLGYEGKAEWPAISGLITQHIGFSYIGIQMAMGVLIPFILLPIARIKRLSDSMVKWLTIFPSVLVLIGVLTMRYNVVVGGQLLSKSMAGYTNFGFSWFSNEGVIPALVLLVLPVGFLIILAKILPPWMRPEDELETEPVEEVSTGTTGYPTSAYVMEK